MISEDRTRKLSIDAAVAKELKRRKLVVWCLWGLIVVAFTLTGWILYQANVVKQAVKAEAKQIVLAEAKQAVKLEVTQTTRRLGSEFTETVTDELLSNDDFVSRIAKAVLNETQIHSSQEVMANSLNKVKDAQTKLQERLSSLELRLSGESQTSETRNIEKRLDELARDIEALKREYDTLPRNYLLKTGALNDLTALGCL